MTPGGWRRAAGPAYGAEHLERDGGGGIGRRGRVVRDEPVSGGGRRLVEHPRQGSQERERARQAQGWKEHREPGDGEEENATVKAAVAVAEAAGTELSHEQKLAGATRCTMRSGSCRARCTGPQPRNGRRRAPEPGRFSARRSGRLRTRLPYRRWGCRRLLGHTRLGCTRWRSGRISSTGLTTELVRRVLRR